MLITSNLAFQSLRRECPRDIRRETSMWVLWMHTAGTSRKFQPDLLSDWITRAVVADARAQINEAAQATKDNANA